MLLLENQAGLLLVAHTLLAGLAVASSTHLALWLRKVSRGQYGKARSTKRFALITLAGLGLTMLVGLALYPTYKVRVRAEMLENPSAITRSLEQQRNTRARAEERNEVSRRYRQGMSGDENLDAVEAAEDSELRPDRAIARGAKLARWFDVKEHWAAFALLLAAAIAFATLFWTPGKNGQERYAKPLFYLACLSAILLWGCAIIGISVTAGSSVVGL